MLSSMSNNGTRPTRNESYRAVKGGAGQAWEDRCLYLYRYGYRNSRNGGTIHFWHHLERGAPMYAVDAKKRQEVWETFTKTLEKLNLFKPGVTVQQIQAWLRNMRRTYKHKVKAPGLEHPSQEGPKLKNVSVSLLQLLGPFASVQQGFILPLWANLVDKGGVLLHAC
jgi:hypothetical protein